MPRVLHNTLGCHPMLHTEPHEITHLCASPAHARAHTRRHNVRSPPGKSKDLRAFCEDDGGSRVA
eukprot:7368265-Prymnesium_polylepis.1